MFLLQKNVIIFSIFVFLIGGFYLKHYMLKSEIEELNAEIITYRIQLENEKTLKHELNVSLNNYIAKEAVEKERKKQESKAFESLKQTPKVIYRDRKIYEKCDVIIETPDKNATGIPAHLGRIGF